MTDPVKQAGGRAFLLPRAPFPHSSSPLRNTTNASSMKRPFGRKCRSSIGNRTCGPAAWSGSPGFRNLQNNSSHGLYNEIMHETDLIKKRLTRNGRAHMLPVLFLSFVAYAGRLQLLPSACAGVFQFPSSAYVGLFQLPSSAGRSGGRMVPCGGSHGLFALCRAFPAHSVRTLDIGSELSMCSESE